MFTCFMLQNFVINMFFHTQKVTKASTKYIAFAFYCLELVLFLSGLYMLRLFLEFLDDIYI